MLKDSNKFACLALSGGMDSTSLLIHLLARNYHVTALSFLYGQKHSVEIQCAQNIIRYLAENGYPVHHHLITLDGLEPLLFSSLTSNGNDVPEGPYSTTTMQSTVVPNRNKIFISILQSVALSISLRERKSAVVAMGIHAGDHAVYPDCRPEFIDADFKAYCAGNWHANEVSNYLPYIAFDKHDILVDGQTSCLQLQLDFDEIYRRTITSYKPNSEGISDYKSGSSIQRIAAFMRLNRIDPIVYADETGIVNWQTVKEYVARILNQQPV